MNYGFHRVIQPSGVIPQAALQIDNTPQILHPSEILIRVKLINLDSTGMSQLRSRNMDIAEQVMNIVSQRGKLHNPVSNSGGVLVGDIEDIGEGISPEFDLKRGDTIIPVVSTSTLPLYLNEITDIRGDQLLVDGSAVLFDGMGYSALPDDFELNLALAAIDVSSIVPQVYRSVAEAKNILVIGAGKSGMAAMAAVRASAPDVKLVALDPADEALEQIEECDFADICIKANARIPELVLREIRKVTDGKGFDLVLNCVNVPDTEAASILSARHGGTVFFYSMATRFDKAALGTDATDNDVRLLIGNGVAKDQATLVFELLRQQPKLKTFFENQLYSHSILNSLDPRN
ncbi:MAG: zinc-binding dehydrogenase [Gammaproteobacteria bacterium]|nr:zinc-binding dehydrogenase [Gammaproteobacteria bacterium]